MLYIKNVVASLIFWGTLSFSLFAQNGLNPIPPQKPILIYSEIGGVASIGGKVEVSLIFIVTRNKIISQIQVEDKQMLGATFKIEQKDLFLVYKALNSASQRSLEGKQFSEKHGNWSIVIVEKNEQKAILISQKKERISLENNTISIDADNAENLARLLKRSKQVLDWMRPRLVALQPK